MSLYPEYERTLSVYHYTDSNTTKKTTKSGSVSFTILGTIIERSELDQSVGGEEAGDFVANINGDYTYASNIRTGDYVDDGTFKYEVVNRPKYLRLFNRYKIILRKIK